MSADNYYIIRKHPNGGYTPVMGFASDQYTDTHWCGEVHPQADKHHTQYDTPTAALKSVIHEYAEYGHEIHPECEERP